MPESQANFQLKPDHFKNQKILVTGGAGFLGKQVIAQLVATGANPDLITVPRSKEHDLRSLAVC
jgi:GDP-L-fucose synthase